MTSMAQAESPLPSVLGLVFFGFPLHPSGKPGVERAEHLSKVEIPMLFLQGDNDALADMALLTPVLERLPGATLHIVPEADHSFHVPKRSGRTDEEVVNELASVAAAWMRDVTARGGIL
jgi:predicted alpha/beta-hydrolase family hydrolase